MPDHRPDRVRDVRGHAAHIRYADPMFGKRETGGGEKPDDKWTVPLWHSVHVGGPESQHGRGEKIWWGLRDPVAIAVALYIHRDDVNRDQIAEELLAFHRPLSAA